MYLKLKKGRKNMNASEKWNGIVKQYQLLFKCQESNIQKEWETYCSELFNYKRFSGEIDAFRKIRIGSSERVIPDIILKNGNKDIVDIELKQYCLPFDSKFEEQLKSYLKLLNLSVGLIVCQKIYLCWFEYHENKLYKIEIPFAEDNDDGIKLMDLLCKENFSAEKIKQFIDSKLKELEDKEKQKQHIQEIKNRVNSDLIKELLLNYFLRENYADDEILQALDEIEVKAPERKNNFNRDHNSDTSTTEKSTQEDSFPVSPAFIIIKTHDDRVNRCKRYFNCSEAEALYHATRHCWAVSYNRVVGHSNYVLAVIDSIVQEVYEVKAWTKVTPQGVWGIDDGKALDRFEFTGKPAQDSIREKFIGKQIPYEYRKKGMASPVLFSK